MTSEQTWAVLGAAGVLALVLLTTFVLLLRSTRRLTRRVEALESALAGDGAGLPSAGSVPVVGEPAAYVITGLEKDEQYAEVANQTVPGRIDGQLFADIVARESVVKAAGLAHGLRRALSAESRNRIRFEMRREVKRSRRQRRADLKAALRRLQEQERGGGMVDDEEAA